MITNQGVRNANIRAGIETRLLDVERLLARLSSRPIVGSPGYSSRRIAKAAHGWSANTWVMRVAGVWSSLLTANTVTADLVGVVIAVVDADTVEIVIAGAVQLLGTSYTNGSLYYASLVAGSPTATRPTAPKVALPVFQAFEDGWVVLCGPAVADPRSLSVKGLLDTDPTTVGSPNDGDFFVYDLANTRWKAAAGSASVLGARTALSVFGNPTNASAVGSDIVAAVDGYVLQRSGTALAWGAVGTVSIAPAAVTAAKIGTDVVLDTLNDVTIASVGDLNLLRYDLATTQWKNYDLGPMIWVAASRQFALDGGSAASAASVVGVGKAASRLYVTSGTGLDFGLSGSVLAGTDINARIRSTGAGDVSFYDQATSTFSAGTKVIEWGTNTAYSTRYFRFQMPLQVLDDSGTGSKNLIVKSTAAQIWTISDDVGPSTWLTLLGTSGDAYGRRLKLGCDIDNGGSGFTFYGDRSNGTSSSRFLVGSTDGNWNQSGNVSITGGGAINLIGTGTTGISIGASGTSDKIGFWGRTPVTKTTVADPSAITTSQTAGGTYTANEQAMLAALKADVIALRATLLNVTDAGQAVGLF